MILGIAKLQQLTVNCPSADRLYHYVVLGIDRSIALSNARELRHDNLLELLGVTEEPDEDGAAAADGELCMTFCLVTEFSPLGSLLSYLRSRGRALLGPATLLSFAT